MYGKKDFHSNALNAVRHLDSSSHHLHCWPVAAWPSCWACAVHISLIPYRTVHLPLGTQMPPACCVWLWCWLNAAAESQTQSKIVYSVLQGSPKSLRHSEMFMASCRPQNRNLGIGCHSTEGELQQNELYNIY